MVAHLGIWARGAVRVRADRGHGAEVWMGALTVRQSRLTQEI